MRNDVRCSPLNLRCTRMARVVRPPSPRQASVRRLKQTGSTPFPCTIFDPVKADHTQTDPFTYRLARDARDYRNLSINTVLYDTKDKK